MVHDSKMELGHNVVLSDTVFMLHHVPQITIGADDTLTVAPDCSGLRVADDYSKSVTFSTHGKHGLLVMTIFRIVMKYLLPV